MSVIWYYWFCIIVFNLLDNKIDIIWIFYFFFEWVCLRLYLEYFYYVNNDLFMVIIFVLIKVDVDGYFVGKGLIIGGWFYKLI